MQTWGAMFALVLRDSGVAAQGQTPNAQMANDAKTRVNMMLAQWMRRRWLTYHLKDTSCVCDGSQSYGVGPGEPLNIPRIDSIEAAFVRQLVNPSPTGQVDYPLEIISSMEDYSTIALKQMVAGPAVYLFFDSGYPTGLAYPYPLLPGNSQWELHIITKAPMDTAVVLTDDILLPEEYLLAIYASSVNMTRAAFQLPADPAFVGMAKAALETLRTSNFQISELRMPAALMPVAGSGYSIWSDSWPGGRR